VLHISNIVHPDAAGRQKGVLYFSVPFCNGGAAKTPDAFEFSFYEV
jgi:hypothetical protein